MLGYGPDAPRNSAMALMDPIAATHAACAVITVLRQRERDGHGARVEMSLHEGGVAFSGPWLLDRQMGGAPVCLGNRHPVMSPHGIYPCAGEDQWLALACEDDEQWIALCDIIDAPEKQLPAAARMAAADAIDQRIGAWTSNKTKEAAAEILQAAGVPAGAVNSAPDMLADDQVRARGFFVPYEVFDTPMPGNPIHMAGLDSDQWPRCPRLGADNHSVLADWLGYDSEQISAMQTAGVLADKPPG